MDFQQKRALMGRNLLPLVTSGFLVLCAYVPAAGAMTAADEAFLQEADAKLDQGPKVS